MLVATGFTSHGVLLYKVSSMFIDCVHNQTNDSLLQSCTRSINNRVSFILVAIGFLCALFAGVQPELSAQERKPLVVATTTIVADTVRNIAGDTINLVSLMGPGVDPHLYKASHGDLRSLRDAELIFYSGLHLEGRMQEVFDSLSKKKRVYALAAAIPTDKLTAPVGFDGQFDPHVWFDISLWIRTLEVVKDALSEVFPSHKELYSTHARRYKGQLETLDQWVRDELARVPKAQRVLITAHDAFGYFGRAYGFEVTGLQGISTASEFGLHDVKRLVDLITERRIKALFVETSVAEKFIISVQQGAAAQGMPVAIGGSLYSDALGEMRSGAETYEGMIRHNVSTIVKALL
jgi:manganese/zinc/iron transport system substrate-binding protein